MKNLQEDFKIYLDKWCADADYPLPEQVQEAISILQNNLINKLIPAEGLSVQSAFFSKDENECLFTLVIDNKDKHLSLDILHDHTLEWFYRNRKSDINVGEDSLNLDQLKAKLETLIQWID